MVQASPSADRGSTVDLGRFGAWRFGSGLEPELAVELETLGYGTLWVGGSPPADLQQVEELLDATSRITVATGIVNIWRDDAATVAASYHRIAWRHPGRFLLGVGAGHPERIDSYRQPYDAVVAYLDQLDAGQVPVQGRVLAALGPAMLRLAAARTAGAHPYLTTPTHTRQARETLGEAALLAPEQKVVLDTEPARARAGARKVIGPYLRLTNYRNNILRTGYSDNDLFGDGSDQLIRALAPDGDATLLARTVSGHLDAGADHVCIQVLGDDPLSSYRELATALSL